jgi:hypothetical protein
VPMCVCVCGCVCVCVCVGACVCVFNPRIVLKTLLGSDLCV